jgi:hypothetical protein
LLADSPASEWRLPFFFGDGDGWDNVVDSLMVKMALLQSVLGRNLRDGDTLPIPALSPVSEISTLPLGHCKQIRWFLPLTAARELRIG